MLPHFSIPAKNQGDKRSHFHVNKSLLVLSFLLILMLDEDQFCGFVLVTRWVHIRRKYIEECCFSSWPETSCFYVQSSFRTDLWWWILDWIPHCLLVEGRVPPWHPCRFCWAVFVQQNPSSYTKGGGWPWIDLHTRNGSASRLVADSNASVASR